MKYLITGGTGLIGSQLIEKLIANQANILLLTRNKEFVHARQSVKTIHSLKDIKDNETIDVIVNLAGEPISQRWTNKRKQTFINSRVDMTHAINTLIERLDTKPSLLLSGSAIGFYGSQTEVLTEQSPAHDEYTHQLCKLWEAEANKAAAHCRVCILRTGVVLSTQGGALSQMLPAFKMGLGEKMGSGEQELSWIHIDDLVSGILFLKENAQLSGAFNLTAPTPVSNQVFSQTLARVLKRPCIFPMPAWVVKLLFGEMGETLLLKGQHVLPQALLNAGFEFEYNSLEKALKNLLL